MNPSELATSSNVIADQAIRAVRAGELRSALGLARHAVRQARADGDAASLYAINALALVQGGSGLFIESIASCVDAFDLAERLGDRAGALHASITMAGAGTFIVEPGAVLESLLEFCTREASALGDDALLVRIGNTYGLYYLNADRFEEAIASYEGALARLGEPGSRAAFFTPRHLLLGNYAYTCVRRAKAAAPPDREAANALARTRIEASLEFAMSIRDVDAEARAHFGIGVLAAQCGDHAAAMAAFGRALDCAHRIHHNPRLVDSMLEMARSQRAVGDTETAVATLDDAFALADTIRPTARLALICDEQVAVFEALGKPREVAHYRAKAAREREAHARENEHARRDLTAYWKRLEAAAVARGAP